MYNHQHGWGLEEYDIGRGDDGNFCGDEDEREDFVYQT